MAIKILHTSDWHVGRHIRGRDRSDEHRAVLAELVEIAADNAVDLAVVAGDVFDRSSPSPAAEEIVWRALLDLAEIAPVLAIAGNHDSPRRLDAVAPVAAAGRITIVGAPRSPDSGGVIELPDLGVRAALLPFVSQRGIVGVEEIMNLDPDQHAGEYQDRLRRVIDKLTEGMTLDTVNLLIAHLTVYGARAGGGEREAHIFGYAVPAAVFPGHLSYVALGHLHRLQRIPHAGAVWYSGSPLQLDFGEVDDEKGALIVEAEPGLPARVTQVPHTAGRRLVTLQGTLDQALAKADEVAGAWVKVVLDEKGRVGLADEVRQAIPGAVAVSVLPTERKELDGEEHRRSLDPRHAFSSYLADRGVEDPRIEVLFAELLEEATG
ncbi:MAG: exonuclease SbcCD subunit D [Acidimicrobiia bacterium]